MKFKLGNINIISLDVGQSDDDFWANVQIEIVEKDGVGGEIFDANLVSPKRLGSVLAQRDFLFGRGIVICNSIDKGQLNRFIEGLLEKIHAEDWNEFSVEFEKYFDSI